MTGKEMGLRRHRTRGRERVGGDSPREVMNTGAGHSDN